MTMRAERSPSARSASQFWRRSPRRILRPPPSPRPPRRRADPSGRVPSALLVRFEGHQTLEDRMSFTLTRAALAGALLGALASSPARAADDARACATSGEQAQELMQAGQLRAARERLIACSHETCP